MFLSINRLAPFVQFWIKYPALLISSAALLGSALGASWNIFYLLPIVLLLLPFFTKKELLKAGTLILSLYLFFFHAKLFQNAPIHIPEKKEGVCHFAINSLQNKSSPFHKYLSYKGTIKHFLSREGDTYRRIPIQISIPLGTQAPIANQDYLIWGTLEEKEPGKIFFKPHKEIPWRPLQNTFSFAQMRYNSKNFIKAHLEKSIPDKQVSTFLFAIFTGEVEDRTMSFFFTKLGLAHLLAISGFHFALLATFFHYILQLFFSPKASAWSLLFLVTSYFFFVGPLASVIRAWIAISLFLLGKIFQRKTSGLNVLGAAMLLEITLNPFIIKQAGFQLSFLCTLAILLSFRQLENLLAYLLPKRSLHDSLELSTASKYGYLFTSFLRKSLALNLAVTIFSLPALLVIFHTFPYMSLFYNLFIPLIVSLIFALLLLGLLFSFLPILSNIIHSLNSVITKQLLDLAYYSPTTFNVSLQVSSFPVSLVICFLCLLFVFTIWVQTKYKKEIRQFT